jgi:hypothetical protein
MLTFMVRWIKQFWDPRRTWRALRALPRYLTEFRLYRKEAPAGSVRLLDMQPELHDRSVSTNVDPHYFYANGWAMRKIVAAAPEVHLDVGSQANFVNLLAAALPVVFLDYRPLKDRLPGLLPLGGDGSRIPIADAAVPSVSSIHVIEHVGLGRYGDPLDHLGTYNVLTEMARILASEGHMYVATPVGRSRVNFNAHRVHNAIDIVNSLPQLRLLEFSGVDDDGNFRPSVPLDTFDEASYACGLFHFQRP